MKHNCNPQVNFITYVYITKKKGLEQEVQDLVVGVAGFELATSASLRRRSNQAEPHPVTRDLLYNRPRFKSSTFFKFFLFSKKCYKLALFFKHSAQKLPHSLCGGNVQMLLCGMDVKHVGANGYAVEIINL